jgi:hypothetical protein
MKRELIARVAHEINRGYCASLGDIFIPSWEDAEQTQRDSILAGVDLHLANPDATPEQSHASWLAQKEAEGWKYGEKKNAKKKEHPCFLPYAELPIEQRAKDYIFRAAVHALKDIPDEAAPVVAAAVAVAPKRERLQGSVPVKYIGRRPEYLDRLYGTGLKFLSGETLPLPAEIAAKFLRHADMFEKGQAVAESKDEDAGNDKAAKQLEESAKQQQKERDEQNALQDLRDQVQSMNTEALENFAKVNYRQDIDKSKDLPAQREQVIGFIDQYGAV